MAPAPEHAGRCCCRPVPLLVGSHPLLAGLLSAAPSSGCCLCTNQDSRESRLLGCGREGCGGLQGGELGAR